MTEASRAPAKPLLLLDVDGVLCPFGQRTADDLVQGVVDGQLLRYRPALPTLLSELGKAFELVWATAWEHAANDVIAPLLGLHRLPVVVFDDQFAIGDTWKLAAIRRFVADRPCAWIDDDIGHDGHAWAAARSVPTLFVDVISHAGLTDEHFERLRTFACLAA